MASRRVLSDNLGGWPVENLPESSACLTFQWLVQIWAADLCAEQLDGRPEVHL